MQSPERLRGRLRAAWSRQRQHWLAGGGEWPLSLSTQPPTESQASASWAAFDAWLAQWRAQEGDVAYEPRQWPRLGTQSLPCRWRFDTPAAVARELGEGARWAQARQRFDELAAWPVCHGRTGETGDGWRITLARHFDLLADLPEADFRRLLDVLAWLRDHPDADLYPRQLPVPGIDSKWVESRRGVVTAWLAALRGSDPAAGFHATTGLRAMPDRLRLRLLDPSLRARLGGLADIEAPLEEVAALDLGVRRVVIVENLATGLAFGDLLGTVLFMRRGYAVEPFGRIPWLAGLPVDYWGDLDTHGLAILSRLRGHLPQVRSLLMDEPTLLAFRSLWTAEDKPHPADWLPQLTVEEADLYAGLRQGRYGTRVRLEQERIAWEWAWQRIVHG